MYNWNISCISIIYIVLDFDCYQLLNEYNEYNGKSHLILQIYYLQFTENREICESFTLKLFWKNILSKLIKISLWLIKFFSFKGNFNPLY